MSALVPRKSTLNSPGRISSQVLFSFVNTCAFPCAKTSLKLMSVEMAAPATVGERALNDPCQVPARTPKSRGSGERRPEAHPHKLPSRANNSVSDFKDTSLYL